MSSITLLISDRIFNQFNAFRFLFGFGSRKAIFEFFLILCIWDSEMCPNFIKCCKETCYVAGCTAVEISGCAYANCNGVYSLISNHSVSHPFYLNTQNHRVIAMYGDRWACRPESNGLPTSTYYEISKYYSIVKIKFSIVYKYLYF